MTLRLLEIIVPKSSVEMLSELPSAQNVLDRWDDELNSGVVLVRFLVKAELTESVLDDLEKQFGGVSGFRVMILSVEASLPRPDVIDNSAPQEQEKLPKRISREELYNDVASGASLSNVFVVQVVLATLVAAVGLIRNDMAVIIGAMVIAPLLGPNVSLSLATTLGDRKLAITSLKTNAAGLAVALTVSILIGLVFPFDGAIEAIKSRTNVTGGDIILALASGCAGVLAFTTGAPAALIGVMVAVALLPPTVVLGLLISAGELNSASGALLLVVTNIICVNLAGVATFFAQGVAPRTWWQADRARKATRVALLVWSVLLLILAGLILLASYRQ